MRIRLFLALMLSIILGLVSGTMAVARVGAIGVTEVTICSGAGVVTVALDANGNPTGPMHPCPDCLAGFGLAVLPVLPVEEGRVARGCGLPTPQDTVGAPQVSLPPQARGPPTAL
ncbi:MAG: hypothetical protein JXR75_14235 [Rhodobacteraceae bacterium]|nr:hypothetical protein [Paracoccaceae bacterium]